MSGLNTIKKKILHSSGLILFSTGVNLLAGFGIRILLSRYLGESGYGSLVIGITVFSSLQTISLLGINQGIAKKISQESTDSGVVVSSGLQIILVTSVALSLIVFGFAGAISNYVFDDASLTSIVRVFSAFVPLSVFMQYTIGATRGLQLTRPRVIIASLVQPISRIILVGAIILLGWGVAGGSYAYLVPYILCAAMSYYYLTNLFETEPLKLVSYSQYKSHIQFSLPLAISGVMMLVLINLDIYAIGYFRTTGQAGVYDIAYSLSKLLMPFLFAAEFLIMPILSKLHEKGEYRQMRQTYTFVIRVTLLAALPAAFLLFTYAGYILQTLFGPAYIDGALSLRILLIGFCFHVIVGPNSEALTSIGSVNSILRYTAAAALLNLILNIVLVPMIGIAGAAAATTASYLLMNLLLSWRLFESTGIIPVNSKTVATISMLAVLFILTYPLSAIGTQEKMLQIAIHILTFVPLTSYFVYRLNIVRDVVNIVNESSA